MRDSWDARGRRDPTLRASELLLRSAFGAQTSRELASHVSRQMAAPDADSLDAHVARSKAEHQCLKLFDELMYCMSARRPLRHTRAPPLPLALAVRNRADAPRAAPRNQLSKYYRDGLYDDCPITMRRWGNCLNAKISSDAKAGEIAMREWRASVARTHIWSFRPVYAEEAHARYGVRPRAPAIVGDATRRDDPVPTNTA